MMINHKFKLFTFSLLGFIATVNSQFDDAAKPHANCKHHTHYCSVKVAQWCDSTNVLMQHFKAIEARYKKIAASNNFVFCSKHGGYILKDISALYKLSLRQDLGSKINLKLIRISIFTLVKTVNVALNQYEDKDCQKEFVGRVIAGQFGLIGPVLQKIMHHRLRINSCQVPAYVELWNWYNQYSSDDHDHKQSFAPSYENHLLHDYRSGYLAENIEQECAQILPTETLRNLRCLKQSKRQRMAEYLFG